MIYTPYYLLGILSGGIIEKTSVILFWGIVIGIIIYFNKNNKRKNMGNNQTTNSGNVLPGQNNQAQVYQVPAKKPRKYSALSIILSIVLGIIVIMLVERLMYDCNRFINPTIDKSFTEQMNEAYQGRRSASYESPKTISKGASMTMDSAKAISTTKVYYKSDKKGKYMMYKSIIYASIVIPLFIFAFVLFFLKKNDERTKALLTSLMCAAFWLMFHLLIVVTKFVMEAYKNIAVYILLLVLVGVFGFLAYYTQSRYSKEKEAKEKEK